MESLEASQGGQPVAQILPLRPSKVVDETELDALDVDLQAEYDRSNVQEVLDKLDRELIGLVPVKTAIREMAALLLVDRTRRNLGLVAEPPGLHMSFTGRPGTGKTTVAMRMADILFRLGYIRQGHVVTASRDDLVGPKTKEVVQRAVGGVLFIDEAYYLHGTAEQNFGSNVVEVLLQAMENQRHELVVIVAGYKDRMNRFFEANPGLASRIDNHIAFPDFSQEELAEIGKLMMTKQHYCFSPAAQDAFLKYVQRCRNLTYFANARTVRNAVDEFRRRQANRIFARIGEPLTRAELRTIEEEDVLASPVFKNFL